MVKGQNQLSQAEIWDDSALVKSWDDALQEYKVCLFTDFGFMYVLICAQALSQHTRTWGASRKCHQRISREQRVSRRSVDCENERFGERVRVRA